VPLETIQTSVINDQLSELESSAVGARYLISPEAKQVLAGAMEVYLFLLQDLTIAHFV
jgi:hypothetical protein